MICGNLGKKKFSGMEGSVGNHTNQMKIKVTRAVP
jgi:hypothetical protein